MRRAVVLFAVLCLLAAAAAAHAVTLEQGWYAQLRSVGAAYTDVYGSLHTWGVPFDIVPGTYGPFRVTSAPRGSDYSRTVEVPATVGGIAPGTLVELPLITGLAEPNLIDYLNVDWHTNYVSSSMRLELIQRDLLSSNVTVLWRQNESGDVWHAQYLAPGVGPNGLAFRVVAVPEPSAGTMLIGCCAMLLARCTRRRRRQCR